MPGADDPGLQIPYLPSVCADSVLLDVAGGKGRPDVDLRLPAAADEAAELGRTPAAMAVEGAVARVVARRAERGVSGRAVRDDPPRSDRRHLVGGRSLRRYCRRFHRSSGSPLPWPTQRRALVG